MMYRTLPQEEAPFVVAATGMSIIAIDRRSGKIAWRYELAKVNENSIIPRVWVDNDRVVVVSLGKASSILELMESGPTIISCLDYRIGTLQWEQRIERGYPTLLVDQDQVIVATTTDVFSFSLQNGVPLWTQIVESQGRATALAIPGVAVQGDYYQSHT